MRTIMKAILASALLIVCPQVFSADLAPPPRFPLEVAPPPTMKSTPASSLLLGSVSVVFDKTTLGQAMKQIKAGNIQHQGDAGEVRTGFATRSALLQDGNNYGYSRMARWEEMNTSYMVSRQKSPSSRPPDGSCPDASQQSGSREARQWALAGQ